MNMMQKVVPFAASGDLAMSPMAAASQETAATKARRTATAAIQCRAPVITGGDSGIGRAVSIAFRAYPCYIVSFSAWESVR